jgi:hypothetical protein
MFRRMAIRTQIRCPSCQGPLVPTELHCGACDLSIRGTFAANEFASLGEEDLHFLRIFVLCEGRIREMESALGVSYPTIKSRLAQLKAALGAAAAEPPGGTAGAAAADPQQVLLKQLDAGQITFDEAMAGLRALRKKDARP